MGDPVTVQQRLRTVLGDPVTMQRRLRTVVGTLALAAIVFYATAVIVREGEAVLVTRFGRPLRAATETGLHWKLPWPIDQASLLDMAARVRDRPHGDAHARQEKHHCPNVRGLADW